MKDGTAEYLSTRCTLNSKSDSYNIKLLNGLVIKNISAKQVAEGIKTGKYLPSDFVATSDGNWIHLKDSSFLEITDKSFNGWMALFFISFILNIIMMAMIFWQKSRIDQIIN
ncbi:hypothetical protein Dacet_1254 [Denitrovibrio acetiphilus DSM 12809]|uniref:Uncharacterized protein n=1 Tax=Denitrovibrio acetiphilus (strain DSM 12809 / NBRC 114555 / N2460) TaxID=522772 RepID=D4H7M7_DENA2|nr:hypothetical protein [Denitrovibrio acetiphilus]ADD68026.1 hypothetical protein Dacet_1254 [Denitrovibrio acetiphilus DSM 12809]